MSGANTVDVSSVTFTNANVNVTGGTGVDTTGGTGNDVIAGGGGADVINTALVMKFNFTSLKRREPPVNGGTGSTLALTMRLR